MSTPEIPYPQPAPALLVQALEDIIEPFAYIERNLPEGYRLDGQAALQQISSREFYTRIAKEALAAHRAAIQAPEGGDLTDEQIVDISVVLHGPHFGEMDREGDIKFARAVIAADRAQRAAPSPAEGDDMLEPLIYAAIMHSGRPKTIGDFEQAAANVADMLKRRGAAPSTPAVLIGWHPIETAPDDEVVVVAWWESDETPHYDFDQREDGCWQRWHDHAEHVEIIGGHGVSYTAPYTHWLRLPAMPGVDVKAHQGNEFAAYEAWFDRCCAAAKTRGPWEAWQASAARFDVQPKGTVDLDAALREIWRECHKLKGTTDGRRHAEAHSLASWVMAKVSSLRGSLSADPAQAPAPAPETADTRDEDDLHTIERAADLLEGYAAYIRNDGAENLQYHPYLPEVDMIAEELRMYATKRDVLAAELDTAIRERDEARQEPWPEWTTNILKMVREVSGYDGYDDSEGVDVEEEVRELIAELTSQIERLRASQAPAVGAEQTPAGYNRPPNGEPRNTDDWNAGYEAGLADGRGVGSAPVAWMYEHDGSLDEPILTVTRWSECREPWNETPLDALALAKHAIEKVWLDAVGTGNGEHSISEAARVRVEFAAGALKLGLRLPGTLRNTGVESPTKENS